MKERSKKSLAINFQRVQTLLDAEYMRRCKAETLAQKKEQELCLLTNEVRLLRELLQNRWGKWGDTK